jgi:pimeloyl-ACP methyl ester carboxylesterase
MIKQSILNRKHQKIAVVVEEPTDAKGLVFIMHGSGAFKEQAQIRTMAETFLEHNYTAVTFDATDSLGESDGRIDEINPTDNYEDLEDVIAWAKTQAWYQEPFVLAGHSLGSMCVALFAEKYPEKVKALAPLSTVVSGTMLLTSPDFTKIRGMWEETKWFIVRSNSKPGSIKKMPWSFVTDLLNYNLMPLVGRLTMPILMVVGEDDPTTTVAHQEALFKALPTEKKELHIIKGAYHTFRKDEHLAQLKSILGTWISTL